MAAAAGDAATVLLTAIAVVAAPAAMVRFTTATVPFEIVPAFIPEATQAYVPELAAQVNVLLAAVRAAPALMEMETTLAGG
jgi:hypothetical protein